MDLKEYFEKINIEEIERFISEGQEENLNIEFKTVNHPNFNQNNKEFDKKNISKVLSGFANSNGGIIVWGIKAKENNNKQDIATEKKPINELKQFLNTLNRLEGQAVTPTVNGVTHKIVEISNNQGYAITYVPASEFAPHMANYSDKHYYKRSGDSFYICEHYDIRDMFQRKHSAKLDLLINKKEIYTLGKNIRVMLTLALINKGQNFAKAPLIKVEINPPYKFADYGLDGNGNIGLFRAKATPRSSQLSTYIGGQDIVTYPDIEYDIDKIELEISSNIDNLPKLILKYMIVSENMEKTNSKQEITIEK